MEEEEEEEEEGRAVLMCLQGPARSTDERMQGWHDLDTAFPTRVMQGRTFRTERAHCIVNRESGLLNTSIPYVASPFLLHRWRQLDNWRLHADAIEEICIRHRNFKSIREEDSFAPTTFTTA